MPELPEVETTRRGLLPALEGRMITNVIKRRDKIRILIPEDFEQKIKGTRVSRIARRAKYLQIFLDSGDVIICHLGMSGKFIIKDRDDKPYEKHDHIIFETDQGKLIIYNDPRRFGLMTICPEKILENHNLFKDMAVEPLGNEFNGNYLASKLASRNSPIKTALLDQHVVVGLGNIYVCEALNLAKISPLRKASELSESEIERLVQIIRDVLLQAIEAGGSSLKDFVGADGNLGYFQHHFVAYGREGESCQNEECRGNIERINQSGRSTFYCPSCQK